MDRVAIVLGLLLVSACGGGDSPPTATEPDAPRVTSIDVSPSILAFAARGDQAQLSFVVRDQTGAVMAGVEVTWSSSDRLVASVTSGGLVEAVSTGTATIAPSAQGVSGSAQAVVEAPVGTFGFAYVANLIPEDVSVVDVATGTVTATIGVGSGPQSVAFAPNSRIAYVANSGFDNVSVIDVDTGTVATTIGVGDGPESVAFAPDGSVAYVANLGSDNVSVIVSTPVENVPFVGVNP